MITSLLSFLYTIVGGALSLSIYALVVGAFGLQNENPPFLSNNNKLDTTRIKNAKANPKKNQFMDLDKASLPPRPQHALDMSQEDSLGRNYPMG